MKLNNKGFRKKPIHIHFKCNKCNSIIDIDYKNLVLEYLKLNTFIEKENGLLIYDEEIMLNGVCHKCMEDSNA
ncbi:hypothetical protein SAMN02745196_00190 [Clostridium collagenovorans DSM 3089]|uniref:Fur family transcriptional regulator, ferric uptake regulator n=1 Tax=Clostridium collagenovorans DSM 3089 TaxID=1121306 RepID=A0A1M5SJS2_9CLOT|nr:hypothetical protein SAMN02745196_00190 [Clostridium collagenovorans DSM 3089]